MQCTKVLFAVILSANLWTSNSAVAQACAAVDIDVCPTLFKERCQVDDSFSKSNELQCSLVLFGAATDAEECAEIDMSECEAPQACDESGDVLDKFFCERGRSQCTKTAKGLAAEFDVLLSELDARLGNYREVIDLDIREVADLEALCNFSRDQLLTFRTQAVENADLLEGYDEQIGEKKQCSATLAEFMDSERPDEVADELWQNLKELIANGLKDVSAREGTIRTQVEKLAAAPKDLDELLLAHRIGCGQ